MKTASVMDSLFAAKSFKGREVSSSGFDGRSVSESPVKGGFAQSFKGLESASSAAQHQQAPESDSEALSDIIQKLQEYVENQSAPGYTDQSKSKALSQSDTRKPESNSQELPVSQEPFVFGSLGLSNKISQNMSGEDILQALAKIATKVNKQQVNLPEMNLDQIHNAVEAGVISIEQLKSMQKSLSQQGVEASVMDLQRVLTASGYERSTQGNQAVYVKQEGSHGVQSQDQYFQSSSKMSFPEMALPLKDGKASMAKGLENASFSQLIQSTQSSGGSISESSGLRLDSALNIQRQTAVSEWAPVVVNKNTNEWNKELVSALGDRLKMQVGQGVKEATVRLDPPELGRVDFSVRIDGDRVQVNINSSNSQVREMLAQQIDRLRNDLSSDNSGASIDVNVGGGKSNNQQEQQEFANKDNVNTVLPFQNNVELTAPTINKKTNLGLNTKA